ncbi:Carnosine synthase 1 [Symbiodinium microadriaticum]|uniref:Carnosine synthase 1 n=1 Tax=Symbiodinium microadriaticum TaxID=2951 RepID=A0A1Q9D750_SYMMI|nr:Carnosine synthase 1 [Symbiodinium microadriaticum]
MGVKAVIIDTPDSWAKSLVEEQVIAKFIPVDMGMDAESVFNSALAAIKELSADEATGPADGICTFWELSVSMASRLAEATGLPGPKPEAVDIARDKHLTRKVMADAGLPSIANMLIENESQLEEAARKVNNEAELLSVYREVVSVMRGLVVSRGTFDFVRVSAAPDGVDLGKVIDATVMLEEYLDGDEVDIDIVMSNGEARYVTVSDNGPTHEPYFGETWGCMPSLLPREKVEDLRKMAEDSVKAIGFENGIFHVEGKYTSRGPRLIEVNARMGGGPVRKMHKHTFGVDLVVEQLFIAVGIPCNPCAADVPKKAVAYACCNAPRGGCIPDRQMFKAFKQREGILYVAPNIKPGDRVFGPEEGMPTSIAEILVESDDGAAAARDFALAVEQQVIVRATREEDPWVVLGVPQSADAGEVRRAFRARVRGAHPDLGGDPERFRSLNKAYDRAMAKLEGRELPPDPVAEAAPPAVKVPTPEEKPKKSPSTLEDFRSWRRQQQHRRDSRRRVENEQRRHRRGVSSRRQSDERAAQQYQLKVQRVLDEVETPEERAMWEREAEMDLIRPQMMRERRQQARRLELQNQPYWERQQWTSSRRSSSAPGARSERRPASRSQVRGERRQRRGRAPPAQEVDAHVGNRTVGNRRPEHAPCPSRSWRVAAMHQQSEAKILTEMTEVPASWPLATVVDAFLNLAAYHYAHANLALEANRALEAVSTRLMELWASQPAEAEAWLQQCGECFAPELAGEATRTELLSEALLRHGAAEIGKYGWRSDYGTYDWGDWCFTEVGLLRGGEYSADGALGLAACGGRGRQKLEEETSERRRLEAELHQSREEGRELRNRLAAAEAEVSSRDAELQAARSESAKSKEQCEEFATRAAAAEAGVAGMQKELRQVQEENGKCQERCEEFATRLQAAEAEASEHAKTKERLARAEADAAEQRLEKQRLEMENLSLKAGSQQSTEMHVEKAVLQDRCEQLQQQLAEARGQLEVLWVERGMYQERLRQLAEMNKKQESRHHRHPAFHPPGPAPSQESDLAEQLGYSLVDEDVASVLSGSSGCSLQQNCFMLNALFKCRMDVFREGSDLQIGSQVLAGDGETVLEVVEIKEARATEVVDLKAAGATLLVTPDHPVPIPNAEGKAGGHHCLPAGKLKVGDFVMNSSGEPVALTTAETLAMECKVLKIVFKPDLPVAVFPNPSSCILSKGQKKSQKRRSVRGRGQQAADPIDEGASIPDTAAGEYTD